jgi:hypothetical protein
LPNEHENEAKMKNIEDRNKIDYMVACIDEFATAANLTAQAAFRYLYFHGALDFLIEHYDIEHTLSFEDVIDDLKLIAKKSGGQIA